MSERNGAIKLQIWQWCLTWPKYFRWPFRNFGSFHLTGLMQTEAGLSACFMHDATPQLMSWEDYFRVFGSSGFFSFASCFWGYVTRISCYCVYNSLHSLRLDFGCRDEQNPISYLGIALLDEADLQRFGMISLWSWPTKYSIIYHTFG